MSINLDIFSFCEDCPHFEARTNKMYADHLPYITDVTCEYSAICKRAHDLGVASVPVADRAKCSHPNGFKILPDGVHELDPCVYEEVESYANVRLTLLKCKKCGHMDFEWRYEKDILDEEE